MSAQILALLIHGTYTSAIQCQHDVFENDCLAFFSRPLQPCWVSGLGVPHEYPENALLFCPQP